MRREIGNRGEHLAAKFYKKNGYKILEKNYVALGHEIDLIVKNKESIVFCEVKTRTLKEQSSLEARPASAVTKEKQKKIINVTKYYIGNKSPGRKIRFDIIEVYLDEGKRLKSINCIESAFNINTAYGT